MIKVDRKEDKDMDRLKNNENIETTCVALGSFDGIHKGHLAVVEKLVAEGIRKNCKSVVLSCFSEEEAVKNNVLTTEEEKAYFLEKAGVDTFVSYNIEGTQTEEFLRTMIIGTLGAKVIVAGKENKELSMLEHICGQEGIELITVETARYHGDVITGSLIRKAFLDCRFEDVMDMCGHPYVMIGEVQHGKALGRTVGMPTANLGVADRKLMPPSGVYATLTNIENEVYKGLTNIGTRPSVDSMPYITIETFLLDFSRDIYGKTLVMEVHLYIRGVQKFDSLDKVQEQVQKDLNQVKEYLDSTDQTCKVGA